MSNHVPLYEAVERACRELPDGWKIEIHLAREAGWVELYDPDGNDIEDFPTNAERMDYTVNDAIQFALEVFRERGAS